MLLHPALNTCFHYLRGGGPARRGLGGRPRLSPLLPDKESARSSVGPAQRCGDGRASLEKTCICEQCLRSRRRVPTRSRSRRPTPSPSAHLLRPHFLGRDHTVASSRRCRSRRRRKSRSRSGTRSAAVAAWRRCSWSFRRTHSLSTSQRPSVPRYHHPSRCCSLGRCCRARTRG